MKESLGIPSATPEELLDILKATTAIRQKRFGNSAYLCSILNAKSGACSEDCAFCAQSCRHATNINTYPLLSKEQMVTAYDSLLPYPVCRFAIVTSGERLGEKDLETVCSTIKERRQSRINWCASLGALSIDQLIKLKSAGLNRYHHNLETSRSFFPKICTTHTFDERVATVKLAKEAGLQVCSGGIFGLGESWQDRIEMAHILQDLHVDAIPLNFLVPIPGTPLAGQTPLSSDDILKIVSLFRLICTEAEIRICAGRERHLGHDEARLFEAGASGFMVGGYLTTGGRPISEDLKIVEQAGMTAEWTAFNLKTAVQECFDT